jgi:hypothetical protein
MHDEWRDVDSDAESNVDYDVRAAMELNPNDPQAIAEFYRNVERRLYAPANHKRLAYSGDVSRNALTESIDDTAEISDKVNAFLDALRAWCKAHKVRAPLADTLLALMDCPLNSQGTYAFSIMGKRLGITEQSAYARYATFKRYLPRIRDLAADFGLSI